MVLRTRVTVNVSKLALGLVLIATLNGWAKSAPEVGILTCDGTQGIEQAVICDFRRPNEPVEAYSGIIEKVDPSLDVEQGGHLVWAVVAKSPGLEPGALSGDYTRVKPGLLVGGHAKALTLRPVDLDSGAGTNFAPLVIKISLVASN